MGEDVLPHLRMTQKEFADRPGISRSTVSNVLHEKRPETADMAMRLGRLPGNDPRLSPRRRRLKPIRAPHVNHRLNRHYFHKWQRSQTQKLMSASPMD